MRPAEPLVSVVVASVGRPPGLEACLEGLFAQEGDVPAEVVVVCRGGEEDLAALARRFPSVRAVAAQADASLPAMRARGMAEARGRMIAVLGDHFRAGPGWLKAIEQARRDGRPVVGGPVEKGGRPGIVDWAAFFCEYAPFMPPIPRGPATAITGNNCAYDRRVLERLGPAAKEEVWEPLLHRRIRALGVALESDPELLVQHEKTYSFRGFLCQRYHYSRSFAALRFADAPLWKRLAFAGATPLLPALVLARLFATLARKRRRVGVFLLCLPAIGLFALAWAWGDAVGALLGPGASLKRVE